jgi:hypothetical protein
MCQAMLADNVDLSAPDRQRAMQMRRILQAVCARVGDGTHAGNSGRFMLHLVWHESRRCRTRRQDGDGPARGFPQFEAHRARDTLEYAHRRSNDLPLWNLLVEAAQAAMPGVTDLELYLGWRRLPAYGEDRAPWYPEGNLIERLLLTSDLFGALLMRIALRKIAAPLPTRGDDDAAYWAAHWKRVDVGPDELRRFRTAATEVGRLLSQHREAVG